MQFEKLGAFYLGKTFDPDTQEIQDDLLLYDAKDLTTHAVCVGMTGSGKTGLCLSLLEEAAIDGIPTIAIDPKGDLGNLLLTFPNLQPSDFRPWIDPGEAARKGSTPDEYAGKIASLWKNGIGQWGQDGERIKRFRDAVDVAIYTPGSTAGLPLSVLRSFAAPPPAVLEDGDLLRDRLSSAVSGLLALLGIEADPLQSREHILLSNILQHAWSEGRDLDLAGLIREIQTPPFERIGVMDLDSFYPSKDRFALSMTINNLLASPGFATWMQGEPLDAAKLLWTPEGKPRIAIISIAHLNDQERMFIVTMILNEVLSWVRTQPGTTSLRALLYMDEVFGYFPPTKNPPSKTPMLTLLKQARAFGLGVVLATQNPVDLDYKGLSNTGTWFLGRLQTERDKLRVLDGLEGASSSGGGAFDRKRVETTLSGMKSRVFMMNNVHEDEPVLFHTRWVLSYLRGPLTRAQIQTLMDPVKVAGAKSGAELEKSPGLKPPASVGSPAPSPGAAKDRPLVPPGVPEGFLPRTVILRDDDRLVYRPSLLAGTRLHFVKARTDLDHWFDETLLVDLDDEPASDLWDGAQVLDGDPGALESDGEVRGEFDRVPSEALDPKSYKRWQKMLVSSLYRNRVKTLWKCAELKETSTPEESEGEFRARLRQRAREKRDLQVAKLEKRYGPKFDRIKERIRKAEIRIEKEKAQSKQQWLSTGVSLGTTVLGAILGRKSTSRAGTAIRGAGRAMKERGDIAHAEQDRAAQIEKLAALEGEFQSDLAQVQDAFEPDAIELTEVPVRPRKSDIAVTSLSLAWVPWRVGPQGEAEPAYDLS